MKCLIASIMTTTSALGLGVAMAQAQNWTRSVPLGDVARQLKAQRAKSEQKPRVFTNDDLVALPTSDDQPAASPATSSSAISEEAPPGENPAEQTSANQTGKESAKATPAGRGEETHGEKYYRDRMSKLQARPEGQLKVAKISPSAVKLVKHPAPSAKHARMKEVRHGAASAPARESARTNPRPAPEVVSRAGAPRQIDAASSSSRLSARQDLGYVEKADGRVEAGRGEETHGEKYYRDRMSKLQVRLERQLKVAKISRSAVKLVKHSAPSAKHARMKEVRQSAASAPARELAKTNPRPAPEVVSRAGAARQSDAASSSSQLSARQDLGYVEKADGRVEAIVAEGEHVRLVQETKSFVKTFHVPAPSPAKVEAARASPPPTNPPASLGPDADPAYPGSSAYDASGSPSAAAEVDAALLRQPEPIPGNNAESESEASATLQSEALADYASDQFHAKPPETLQATPCPVLPASAPEGGANHSIVRTLGYVEKADGEREAIVEVFDQVYLVHEGELFAEKYRALHVTPSSVEIVEELTEASSAAPERKRKSKEVYAPVSR